jgi:hypothetical protein
MQRGGNRPGQDVKRKQGGVKFEGVGYMAEIVVETANPGGEQYIKDLCKKIKATKGVKHCAYWWAAQTPTWENIETHARAEIDRPHNAAQWEKKNYTMAVIQWIYIPPAEDIDAEDGEEVASAE